MFLPDLGLFALHTAFQSPRHHGGDREWILRDVAGFDTLGSSTRIQNKRRLIGEAWVEFSIGI